MKKTVALMVMASLLLTSCGLRNLFSFDFKGDSEDSDIYSSEYESESKSSTSKPSKYDQYKDREWYGIGLDIYTDSRDINNYYDALIDFDTFKVGKYMCTDESWGCFNFYICANGDAAMDNLEDLVTFDKSEYQYVTAHFDEQYTLGRYYTPSPLGYSKEEAKLSYYLKLAMEFYAIPMSRISFNAMELETIDDVYSFYGINILDKSVSTAELDNDSAYVLRDVIGYGPSYDERFITTKYMNCNPLFKFVGLPPFLSESNVTSWSYRRGVVNGEKNNFRLWQDKQLVFVLSGYSAEEAKTWPALFSLAGYKTKILHENFDNPDALYDSLSYEGTIDIFGVSVSSGGGSTAYFTNTVKLDYSPSKWVNNEPVEYSVQYVIECAGLAWVDLAGNFLYHDDGLHIYYTDNGVSFDKIIVNSSGEIVTESITRGTQTNNPWVVSFFFPHQQA